MTTMLEKMTEVIEAKIRAAQPIYDYDAVEIARAALEAIRDAAQTDEGQKLLNDARDWERNSDIDMIAMIDAILIKEVEDDHS